MSDSDAESDHLCGVDSFSQLKNIKQEDSSLDNQNNNMIARIGINIYEKSNQIDPSKRKKAMMSRSINNTVSLKEASRDAFSSAAGLGGDRSMVMTQ